MRPHRSRCELERGPPALAGSRGLFDAGAADCLPRVCARGQRADGTAPAPGDGAAAHGREDVAAASGGGRGPGPARVGSHGRGDADRRGGRPDAVRSGKEADELPRPHALGVFVGGAPRPRRHHEGGEWRFEQALTALGHIPETHDSIEQAIDIRCELRTALVPSGDFERIRTVLTEARHLSTRVQDAIRLGRVANYMSALHYFFGEPHQGFVTGREAIAVADTAVRVVGQAYAGMNLWELGEHREAVDYFRAAIAALKDRLVHERFGQVLVIGVLARVGLAGTLAELGDFDEAIAVGEQGVEIAQAAEHATSVATAQWGLGLPHLLRGNIEKALAFLQDAVIACREMNLRT